jgi:hypothetical protein
VIFKRFAVTKRPNTVNDPGSGSALVARLRELKESAGSWRKLSEYAGVPENTLRGWINDGSPAPFLPIARLAAAMDISLEWMASGALPKKRRRLDSNQLKLAIEAVEEGLAATHRVMNPAKKSELAMAIYDLFTESEHTPDRATVIRLIRAAA